MHFWNITALAKRLGNNQISEIQGMYYFLASNLIILFATYYALWWGVSRNWLLYFEIFVLSVIAIFGCFKAFEANGGNEGQLFVLRAICLSVPIGIRVNVYSITFGLALYQSYGRLISFESFGDPERAFSLIGYTGFIGFSVYFWWLLVAGFRKVKTFEKST